MRSNFDECDDWYNDSYLEEVMNRDYFTKPIQTSRNMHDYGNMGKVVAMERESDRREGMGLFTFALGLAIGLVITVIYAWIG